MPVSGVGYVRETLTKSGVTTTGSDALSEDYSAIKTLRAQLNVTAVSGTTPSLTVIIEDSCDGGATWNTIGTFAAKTAAAREVINITTPFTNMLRVTRSAISGTTPSFTFTVDINGDPS